MTEKKTVEYTFKVIVIGDCGTGKSSWIQRYVFDRYLDGYKATIGVDFVLRTIRFEEDTIVKVQLWDISGQERFGGMTRVYYKDAIGCLLLFDLSSYSSFESVKRWKDDLDKKVRLKDGRSLPCVLVGNKSDLTRDPRITNTDINELIKTGEFTAYCRCSAKLNQNVNESVNLLIADVIGRLRMNKLNNKSTDEEQNQIRIDDDEKRIRVKPKCSTC